jgi:putative DNA primase/helicase
MRWFIISAVARVMVPGIKADTCLVLEGNQGLGKSGFLRTLAGEWFSDSPIPLGNKDAFLGLRGVWIAELAELGAFLRKDPDIIKQFMSSPVDRYRPPYATEAEDFPRQCVFAGTVNHFTYLKDATGARRFNPVRVTRVDLSALERDRDQLWAEAMLAWRAGESWWPTTSEQLENAELAQEDRFQVDAWEAPLTSYLCGCRNLATEGVTIDELLLALDIPRKDHDRSRQERVLAILERLEFKPGRPRRSDGSRPRAFLPPGSWRKRRSGRA